MRKLNYVLLLLILSYTNAVSQQKFEITITPNHEDWTYYLGEKVQFLITITEEVPSTDFTIL
jgi:hypothetical protein